MQQLWWGAFNFSQDQAMRWAIGERAVIIERKLSYWNTWSFETATEEIQPLLRDELAPCELKPVVDADALSTQTGKPHYIRHLQAQTNSLVSIAPALADRSVVVRLSSPVRLLAGQKACIYVSTPVWFQARALPGDLLMLDEPFWRPSDSWFGANTREGEFCYAKFTDARLELESLPVRAHRAITPIAINNQRNNPLDIERISLPVPLLSIYSDTRHQLWTQTITVTRDEGDEEAELVLGRHAPPEATQSTLVAEPRIKIEQHAFKKALSSLFA